MQKFAILIVVLALAVGIFMPGKPAGPAAAASAQQGLFEAPPYKETQLERKPNGHFYATAYVNGAPIEFMVDTGASMVALTQEDARAAGIEFSPDEFVPIAQTANGVAKGKLLTLSKVSIEGKEVTEVEAAIMENGGQSLLGQAYLSRISGVQMNGEYMILR